jgi:hypothetical protein
MVTAQRLILGIDPALSYTGPINLHVAISREHIMLVNGTPPSLVFPVVVVHPNSSSPLSVNDVMRAARAENKPTAVIPIALPIQNLLRGYDPVSKRCPPISFEG